MTVDMLINSAGPEDLQIQLTSLTDFGVWVGAWVAIKPPGKIGKLNISVMVEAAVRLSKSKSVIGDQSV